MESLLKSDIFFVITSVSVILVSCALLVLLFYALKVMRLVHEIVQIAKRQAQSLSRDVDDVRDKVRAQENLWGVIKAIFSGFTKANKGRKR